MLCALLTSISGVLLAGQVGIGDPAVGANYTLQSISAVVLGGASIFGGRGSFLGACAHAGRSFDAKRLAHVPEKVETGFPKETRANKTL